MSEIIQFQYPDPTRLVELAKRRGYDTIEAYLTALIAADEAEDEVFDVAADLRDAMRDVIEGRVYPASSIWDLSDIVN